MIDKKWSYKIIEMETRLTKYNQRLEQLGNDPQYLKERIILLRQVRKLQEEISQQKLSEVTVFDLW